MPPKKRAVDIADSAPSSSDARTEDKADKKTDAAAVLRKLTSHPSTLIMVKEALQELDSRKGVSSQAIQNYIKQKYPSVDLVRLKPLVRRTLKKGIETGTLVRPANSAVTTGAVGKFRLAPKVKEAKPKTENKDPNVQKALKVAKDEAKKLKAGAPKKKDTTDEQVEPQEDSKPPKRSKRDEQAVASKPAPAKKPKAKKVADKEEDNGETVPNPKPAKTTKKAKAEKAPEEKAAKAGTAAKATGKRGKKSAA